MELYAGLPGRQLAGLHLLGYAYYMSHDLSRALETFKLCVNGTSPPLACGPAHARTALLCTALTQAISLARWPLYAQRALTRTGSC